MKDSDVVYHVLLEKFLLRRGNGLFDLEHPVGQDGAKEHLRAIGYLAKEANSIIYAGAYPRVHEIDVSPGQPTIFRRGNEMVLNAYVRPTLSPAHGDWPTIREIREVVTGGDPEALRWLDHWMAYKVQNPGARSMTAVVCQGGQGIGKTLLGTIMTAILGPENCVSITQAALDNAFNAPFIGKLFICADEVFDRENAIATSNLLKAYITDARLLVNAKHVKQYQIRNRTSWWFTSNMTVPVRIEGKGDRRYTVFMGPQTPPPDYKAHLEAWFASEQGTEAFAKEVMAFADHLHHVEVDVPFIMRPLPNEARTLVSLASRSSVDAFLDEIDEMGSIDVLMRPCVELQCRFDWEIAGGIECQAVYRTYRHFCDTHGFRAPVAAQSLGREIAQKRTHWRRVREGVAPRRWTYVGIPRDFSTWAAPLPGAKPLTKAQRESARLHRDTASPALPEAKQDEAEQHAAPS